MTIRIVEEPEIVLTRSEYDRLKAEYEMRYRYWSVTVPPLSFEEWVQQIRTRVVVADGTQPNTPRVS